MPFRLAEFEQLIISQLEHKAHDLSRTIEIIPETLLIRNPYILIYMERFFPLEKQLEYI